MAHTDPPEPAGAIDAPQRPQAVLSERISKGISAELGEVFHAERPRLVGMLIYLGAPAHLADDVVQEAFLELGRTWDKVRDPSAWLRRATRSHFFKACEKIRKAQQRERGLAEKDDQVPDPSAEVTASVWEDQEWVDQLIRHLSPAARETVELILEDYSRAEIAAHLGVSENAVRQRLHSAKKQIKRLRGPDYTIKDKAGPARTPGEGE